ncbi:MAG: ArnT family glycosyltransferase [Chitinophagales bacterium]
MNRKISFTTLGLLLLVFLLSVLVRMPNINRPLSKHHEFVTGLSVRIVQIMYEDGAVQHAFNPITNYNGLANKNINNHASTTGTMVNSEGNYFYVSHPPFAYMLPYAVHKALHIKPTVLSIQIFHLCINFLTALFVYFIICLLGQQKPLGKVYISALIGFIVYLFNPAVLWFQCNTYMSDMLVHFFFVLGVYTMLKLLMRKRFFSPKYLIIYAIVLFLMIYTSWLGLFFAFSVFVYSLLKLRFEKVFLPLVFITMGITFFSLALIVWQASQIGGTQAYIIQMLDRFGERGSFGGNGIGFALLAKLKAFGTVLFGFVTSYLPVFLLMGTFGWLVITKAKLRIVFTKNGYRFLWLSTLPVVLLHLSLMNYAGHDFVNLYASLFFAVLIAILYDKLRQANTLPRTILNGGVVIVVLLSLGMYYYINRPGEYSMKGDYYAEAKEIGEYIQQDAKDDEVVFFIQSNDVYVEPQVVLYAQRNIERVVSEQEAIDILIERDFLHGILYQVDENHQIFGQRIIAN